jgi:hypothetical protein
MAAKMSEAPPEEKVPVAAPRWPEGMASVIRRKWFVLTAIAASWTVILLANAFWPRAYIAEATVALPNTGYGERRRPEPSELRREADPKPGISIGTYKKVEAALADQRTLAHALRGTLSLQETEAIRRRLGQIITPVTTGARDELIRADRQDTVTAVRLTLVGPTEDRVSAVVTALAALLREAIATRVARDYVEAEMLQATSAAAFAVTRKLDLIKKNESLRRLAHDLGVLAASAGQATGSREVVDLDHDGHRFLPPAVQHNGARAWLADNDFEIRQAEWTLRVESLKIAYYRRLETRLRGDANAGAGGASIVEDVPTVIDRELREMAAQQSDPSIDFLKAEAERLRDLVQAHRAATDFIQRPSVRPASRTPWTLAGLALAVIGVVAWALARESWGRLPT